MKKLLVIIAIGFSLSGKSQGLGLGVRLFQFGPNGDLGYLLKNTVGAEVMMIDPFEDRWRMRFAFGFANPKPRMDTFPVYMVENGSTIHPGTLVLEKFWFWFFSGGADFNL